MALLAPERRAEIARLIQTSGSVRVAHLCQRFKVTEETIRRDLEALEKSGILERTYGGAVSPKHISYESPYDGREIANKDKKTELAETIADMVTDRETLLLDASSTSLYVARALIKRNLSLTIVTNSLAIVNELRHEDRFTVLCTGGTLRGTSLSFVGPHAERAVKEYHVDKAIVSCKGFHIQHGLTDSNELEVEMKKLMLESANQVIAAIDSTKWGYVGFALIAPATSVDLIVTDSGVSKEQLSSAKDAGLHVIAGRDGHDALT